MPVRLFTALARGEDAPDAARFLAEAEYSKHLLLLRAVVDEAESRGHPQAAAARDGYRLLAEMQRLAPEATERVIRYPAVGAWALRTLWLLLNDHPPGCNAAAQPRRMAALAASAAMRGGVELVTDLWTEVDAVSLPSVGRARFPGADDGTPVRLRVHRGGGADLRAGGVHVSVPPDRTRGGWEGTRVLDAGFRVPFDDVDPFRFLPGARLRERLAEAEILRWAGPLAAGWRLLDTGHPVVAAEVRQLLSVLVPLEDQGRRPRSASTRAAFGCVALSRPAGALDAALTLTHEVQHVKLSALMDLFPLVREFSDRRYYAPWRDDPRPLTGLLHGTYAFMGVAAFWGRQRRLGAHADTLEAHTQFARWREAAMAVTATLIGSDHLTPLGQIFVAGMMSTLRELCEESVPSQALTRARRVSARHRARWLTKHA